MLQHYETFRKKKILQERDNYKKVIIQNENLKPTYSEKELIEDTSVTALINNNNIDIFPSHLAEFSTNEEQNVLATQAADLVEEGKKIFRGGDGQVLSIYRGMAKAEEKKDDPHHYKQSIVVMGGWHVTKKMNHTTCALGKPILDDILGALGRKTEGQRKYVYDCANTRLTEGYLSGISSKFISFAN